MVPSLASCVYSKNSSIEASQIYICISQGIKSLQDMVKISRSPKITDTTSVFLNSTLQVRRMPLHQMIFLLILPDSHGFLVAYELFCTYMCVFTRRFFWVSIIYVAVKFWFQLIF